MNMLVAHPAITTVATLVPDHLELAPAGWRACVEAVAQGATELYGKHAYCQFCGGAIEGGLGHRIDCVTLLARRIKDTLPLLLARHHGAAAAPGVDIDAAHTRQIPAHATTAG